jgi:hypothetical protein
MGRTIDTFYTYRERPRCDGKGPLILFNTSIGKVGRANNIIILIGKEQVAMGKAHMNIWERPRCNGKGPHVFMGRTIDIFYTYRERPRGNGKEPLTLCTPIGTDQDVMGRTIDTLYIYRERPGGMGKGLHVFMRRTIDIFYTHRERPGGNGKEPLTLCTPIGTDQGVMGRTIDIFYTHRERAGGNGKEPLTLCISGKRVSAIIAHNGS